MVKLKAIAKVVGYAVLLGAFSFVSLAPVNATWLSEADKKGKDKKEKKDQAKEEREKKDKLAKKSEGASSTKKAENKTSIASRTAPPVATPVATPTKPAVDAAPVKSEPVVPVTAPAPELAPAPAPKPTTETNTTNQPPAQKDTQDEDNTFRINSNLVAVPVSVTDGNGEPVRNLKAEEFKLFEEGENQQVQSLGEPGKTPLELTLLFDVSGSVFERFDFQKQAASRFLQQVLKPNDVVSVFLIGFEGKLVIPRTRNFPKVINDLKALEPTKEGTAFHASVARAADYLNDHAETGSRRVMVVISDGEDNFSKTISLLDAQRALQRTDIVFYSINPSGPSIKLNRISMRGQNAMISLANETGGVAFLPDQESELDRVFRQIAAELQAQYLLGYYSTNETNDGKFRRIKIQLPKHGDLRIRARQGYYAPKE
jgi:Ca-activated chloride channel family protein